MAILHSQTRAMGVPGASPSMFASSGEYKKPEWTDAVSEVERKYEITKRLQVLFEKTWYLNIAFYLGRQYVDWSNLKAGLYEPKAPSWRVRLPCNRILGPIQSQVSKLVAMRPAFNTMPNTGEEEDRLAARLSEKALEFLFEKLRLRRKLSDLLLWTSTCGTGFIKVGWNDESGEPMKVPRTENVQIPASYDDGSPVIGEDGMPAMISTLDSMRDEQGNELYDVHHQGEVNVEVVSPFDIFPDPGAIDLADARWVIHTRWMSIDEIRGRYKSGGKVHPERDAGLYGSYARRLRFDFLSGFASSVVPADMENRALVKEYWERPSREHKKGRLLVVANGAELHDGPLPYNSIHNPLPFVKFDDIRAPGRFWSQSKVEQLRPLQMSYNRGRSSLVESRNLMSKPKWLVAKGSGIIDSGITSEPGEIIEYDASAGPRPEPVKGPEVPQYLLQLLEQDIADMMEISGLHEISQGQTPPGVESGRAVLALQAADESRHGDLAISYEEGLADVARLILERVSEFYVEPRLLKISGKDNSYEVVSFRGADLRDNIDVRVQIGSALPQNKAYRQQTLLQWLQLQVITPQDFLKLMEFGKYERMWEDSDQDRNWARQENEQMAQGVQLNPEMHEDHAIHMEEHVRFMKAEAWRMLPEQAKQLFRMHLQITQQMMAPAPAAEGQASPPEAAPPGVAGAGPMNSPEFTGSENAQPPGVDLRQERGLGAGMGMGGM